MDFFKRFLSSFGICRPIPKPRPIAFEFSILATLPPELIVYIAEFLPFAAAASFSLCCTPVYSLIGAQYLEIIRNDEDFASFDFLTLLERDLPDHILCHYCKKLHAIKYAERYVYAKGYYIGGRDGPPSDCWIADQDSGIRLNMCFNFSSTVFQMVMKRHRQGADCSSLLALFSYQAMPCGSYVVKYKELARIVNGSLLQRSQRMYLWHSPMDMPSSLRLDLWACHHNTNFNNTEVDGWIGRITGRRLAHWDEPQSGSTCGGLLQCRYCTTEYRIDFKDLGEAGVAIFFTKWHNHGEGISPEDHLWRCHLMAERGTWWKEVYFPAGSICAAFEGGEKFEFDSLLNVRELSWDSRKRRYQTR